MNHRLLGELARAAGIELEYTDSWGDRHVASEDTQRALLRAMGLVAGSDSEIHESLARLQARSGDDAPLRRDAARAWRPAAFEGNGRRWGISVQLYALRSARNWGIGDFTDLSTLMRGAAALGAAAVGVNPLHALFPTRPQHASPYSPSDRRFVNPLYLDVESIADFPQCAGARKHTDSMDFRAKLEAARDAGRVDYESARALKWPVLMLLYREFRNRCLAADDDRAAAFRAFQRRQGIALRRFATFLALMETQVDGDWHRWPRPLTDPRSPAVEEFATEHIEAIEFHEYLQWQAAVQLEKVEATARECGMSIGLYADLAVGADPTGAEVWSAQDEFVQGVTIGAPPDALNLAGQDWGLPPLDPIVLASARCAPYAELLRANMRRVGALRIDHILGLMRMYWIPSGAPPGEGAYVRYPWPELQDVLVQESRRHHCLLIGEDLGTVPDGLREAMRRRGVLSYRLLYFEEREGAFPAPHEYPADALITAGTHDLPSLSMWWQGEDVELRNRLGLWPDPERYRIETERRQAAKRALLEGLRAAGLDADGGRQQDAPAEAIFAYMARTPCKLLMVQPEDVLGLHAQVNVPGTTDQYPNWRTRLPCSVEDVLDHPRMRRIADRLNASGRDDRGQ
ncbi:MAG TPA: 4-alpha-glucanotransferase [Rhodanobacteraceae bacterium]|nr:4-alpha-glucanotransferase [Rhodanobacteraceae bacterium]